MVIAAVVIIGLLTLTGIGLLVQKLSSEWTTVICVDAFGKVESKEWVKNTKPDRYPSRGANHVREYVERLAASDAEFAHLSVFAFDHNRGFGLHKRRGEPIMLGMTFEWRQHAEHEQRARKFFDDLNIHPDSDYLAGNGGVPDATRVLDWPIGTEANVAADICDRVLRELCEIEDAEGLEITFEDKPSRSIRYR